jgi:putative transposase
MQKAFKYRIYPNRKTIQKLEETLGVCRILYNSCLLDRKRRYEQTGKGLSRIDQQVILKKDKQRVEELNAIHSQVLQDVLFRVERAFQAFFRRVKSGEKPGYPRLKGEGRYDSITYPQQPGYSFEGSKLRLAKIGLIKIKMHREIQGEAKTCTIRRQGERWYACFASEYEPQIKLVPSAEVGIDVGIKNFAVLSNGQVLVNPQNLRKAEAKLKQKQRWLSRKVKGSKNRKKARKIVARLHSKVRDRRAEFHHQETRKIVNQYGYIVAEELNIKGMVRNRHLSKSIADAGWGQFLQILAYKAEEAGCRFEKVAPQNTSLLCSECGEKVPKTLAQRRHRCPSCGFDADRDHNAAINILHRAGTAPINACREAVQ